MAADGVNSEITEWDGDKVVTMMDVLQEQQDFEEDANAVLGASDDKNCTFPKGYIKRQALYACLTCCPDAKTDPLKRAGVCLACSLNCHENHELVELYTKRNFRCDCGNPLFNSHPCQFTPSKPDLNADNIYNHNFSGIYCICKRPYPDPEATSEDDMIQCIICEDWLHASHLDTTVPTNDQYSEMICKGCMEKNEFLHDYSNFAVNFESVDVDIIAVNGEKSLETICNGNGDEIVLANGKTENTVIQNGDVEMSEDKDERETVQQNEETPSKDITSTDNSENSVEMDSAIKHTDQHESLSSDAKETNEDNEKSNESEEIEVKKSDLTSEQGHSVDDQMDSTDSATNTAVEASTVPNSKGQEQKEELSTNNVETDVDISDENKTEDQLLDDIRALTSDNIIDEESKPITEKAASMPEDQHIKSSEIGNNQNIDHSEETIAGQSNENSVNADNNPASEPANVAASNILESKDTTLKNTDHKTDTVMAAIDALLEDPTDTDGDCKDTQKGDDKPTSTENIETQGADIGINENDTIPVETVSTDIEMTENKSQNDPQVETTVAESTTTDINADAEKVEVTENGNHNSEPEPLNETNNKLEHESDNQNNQPIDESNTTSENKRKLSIKEDENSPKKAKLDNDHCSRPKNVKKVYKGATFWPSNFRQKLCTCGECISMYKDLHVLFLTDPDDTVSAYENLGKENVDAGASQYEKGLQALSSLDRIQQINALTEYNKMRDKLLDYLKSFKDRKVIVKEEDIKAFFAGMKPRREPDGVYFCR